MVQLVWGVQMASALAEAGANVVIASRKIDRCIIICETLEKEGVLALPVACDVSKIEDCETLVETTVKKFGTLDILVNNAGCIWVADSLNFPIEKWQRVINLNITGTFQLSAAAARIMKKKGGGKIVNIASIGALGGDYPEKANSVAYTTSKGGIITMTKDLAVKWARYGINVNAVCPGWFPSGMNANHLDSMTDKLIPRIPLGRFGGNDDLKGLLVFLCSGASDYITGQYIGR